MSKTYLVGGAVRDNLLGLPIHEKDYVVVGATLDELIAAGFRPVGKDFPVLLHPKTHEEYALARTERKIAQGHQGFQFYANPSVTLEEDLQRRDLTINAIAQDDQGRLIDPYHGQADLNKRILRHVSAAFSEDPLRILRVARFRAYLGSFEFKIAAETLALMQDMIKQNALRELSAERLWQEILRALQTDFPELFFETLVQIGAMPFLFEQPPQFYFKSASFGSKEMTLVRFAVLSFGARYLHPCPKEFEELAKMAQEKTLPGLKFPLLSAAEKVHFLKALDFLRRPERFENWLLCAAALFPHFPIESFENAADLLRQIDRQKIAASCSSSTEIATQIFAAECKTLTAD